MKKRVIVIGSSFAGLTAALEIKERLGAEEHAVIVLSAEERFLFQPSLVWVPFGARTKDEISFPVAPVLESKGIAFKVDPVVRVDLDARRVETTYGAYDYDFLLLATGPKLDFAAVPGLGPEHHSHSVFTWEHALRARGAIETWLAGARGPIVVGAVPGASLFSAAYEFLFLFVDHLKKQGVRAAPPITFVTPEPYIGHLGADGYGRSRALIEGWMKAHDVSWIADARVAAITDGSVQLFESGDVPSSARPSPTTIVPASFVMLAPPLLGADPIAACSAIVDERGFVKVDGYYRTERYPEVFAAGSCISLPRPATRVPCDATRTGYLAERTARVAAHNLVVALEAAGGVEGGRMLSLPPSSIETTQFLDMGSEGLVLRDGWSMPGPQAHWAKVAFERWFLATRRRGVV